MKHAFVTINLLDLRAEPKHDSERVAQLLFADPVTLGPERRGFVRVTDTTGYTGWADRRFLQTVALANLLDCQKLVNRIVAVNSARLLDSSGHRTRPPHLLYYGTRLAVKSFRDGLARVRLPNNTACRLKANVLRPISRQRGRTITGTMLVTEARKFLGVPYLWGGNSPAGFDCSGLVKAVCLRFGIIVPRDTRDQIGIGRRIDPKETRTGDLLFFDRHVGFALGRKRLVHSSRGGGGVRIESLTPGDESYREDLDQNFDQVRRIV